MEVHLRRILAIGLVWHLCGSSGWAQDEAPADFNALRTPSSPAFVLLGIEPSAVERPNTPADFAASVLNASSNLTSVPKDFALETSPYWLFGHPRRDWRDDVNRNVLESIKRTFTLAAASAELGTPEAPVRGLAVSGRMSLISGKVPDTLGIAKLEQALAASAGVEIAQLAPLFDAMLAPMLAAARTQEEKDAVLARFDTLKGELIEQMTESGELGAEHEGLREQAQALVTARQGLLLDVAGGVAWRAPSASLDSARFDRWGIWATATYAMPKVSFLGVVRYLGFGNSDEDALDIGGRVIYTRDRFAVSAEYIGRHLSQDDAGDQWRLAGVLDYRISDDLWLNGSFGRSYDDDAPGSLVAQLGLTLNLSKERYDFEMASEGP